MPTVADLRDTDAHFVVNPVTRTISKNEPSKNLLIQYDHNSEVFTFEMPRCVEGHDMKTCNRVEIHYLNIGSNGTTNEGVYEVEDFEPSEDEENTIVWSWAISNNATQLVGSLSFAFRFASLTDTVVDYAWSTAPYTAISISAGIYNGATVLEPYADILEQWERRIGIGIDTVVQEIESTEPNGLNVVRVSLTDGSSSTFNVRNGKAPVRGTDYWTENDKTEIINDIYGIIPRAEGVDF